MGPFKEVPEFYNAARSVTKSDQPIVRLSVIRVSEIGETLPDS